MGKGRGFDFADYEVASNWASSRWRIQSNIQLAWEGGSLVGMIFGKTHELPWLEPPQPGAPAPLTVMESRASVSINLPMCLGSVKRRRMYFSPPDVAAGRERSSNGCKLSKLSLMHL